MPRIVVGAHALNVEISGRPDGFPIILSNSLAADLSMWNAQMAVLESRRRVIRYDVRGHGLSDVVAEPCTIADLGGDVLRLMDALHLDQVDWCGLSLGGMIGQWLMINHGDRIAKALLANTVANMPNAAIWEDRIGRARREGLSDLAETTLGRWFTPEFAQAHPATIAKVRAMILSTSVEGYCRACEAIRDLDLYDQLDTISNEVMLVCGRYDSSAPTATMTSMSARIKNASIQILDAAHVSNIEQPTAFNAIVSKLFC